MMMLRSATAKAAARPSVAARATAVKGKAEIVECE